MPSHGPPGGEWEGGRQQLAGYNSQVIHKSYPDLWKTNVDNLVGKQGKTGGHRVDNQGKPGRHTQDTFGRPHTAHSPCA